MDLTAKEIMDALVSFPSVSRDGTKAVADWVQNYLTSHGIDSHRMNSDDGKNNSWHNNRQIKQDKNVFSVLV